MEEKEDKKKIVMLFIIILETVILAISLLYSAVLYVHKDVREKWFEEFSSDGRFFVRCYTVGNPVFYGPQNLSVTFDAIDRKETIGVNTVTIDTSFNNRGATLHDDNYSIEWLDNHVRITFQGVKGKEIFMIPYYTDK